MNKWIAALERRPLSRILAIGFALLLLGTIVISLEGIRSQRAIMNDLQVLHDKDMQGVANGKDAQAAYATIGRNIRQALITPDAAERQRALSQLDAARVAISMEVTLLRGSMFREENKKYLATFEENYGLYLRGVDKAVALLMNGNSSEATSFVASQEFQKPGIAANENMKQLIRIKEEGAQQSYLRSLAEARRSQLISAGLLVAGVLFGTLIWVLVSRSVNRPLARLRDAVKQLASGKLEYVVPHSDYANEVGDLARAVVVLQTEAQQMEAQRWIKTHMAAVSTELQAATSFNELSQTFLSHVAPLLKVGHAVFYIFEEEQRRLRLLSGYAFRERKDLDTYFAVGQGLVGQCALERAPIIITKPPADYIRIGSSLGEAVPNTIAVLPVLHNEQLLAVVELATFESFGVNEQALLDGLMPVLAMSMEIIERNTKTQQLLEETRHQAESMEKQAAKLEEQAVEMEAQQQEIKATEAWFRSMIETAPDGMLVIDEQGSIILTNPQIEAMFGYQPGELLGTPIETLVPHDARGRHVALRDNYITDANARDMAAANRQQRGVRKDNSGFPLEIGLSRLPAVGGRGKCVCASIRDITARKEAEDRLAMAEERSRLILGAVGDGIVGLDSDGYITFANPAAPSMLGYREDEFVGQKMHPLVHHHYPDGREFPREECSMYLSSHEGQSLTVDNEVLWHRDGSAIPVEYTTTVIRKDGAIIGTVVVYHDITERKAAENEIILAKEIAEEATKAKSDFLANMSHEIRTPMNAIIGMSHLALQTELDKKQRNYIEKVKRAGENLLGIINDILDFSKIEAGKMAMERIDFRLEDVMDHLANLVGLKAEDKGLELLFDCEPDVPTALVGDPLRLGQVLVNLGNNAVKFTEEGEIVVGIEKVAEDENGAELHFWVRDSGIGMTPEQCGKMFQSFSQADASTTRKYGGTGLGLAISKTLAGLMQGRIWVESKAGKGSTFHFTARFGLQSEPMQRRMFLAEELLGVRVLVVDDNASAREILSTMARNFGLGVDTAQDGQQALNMIAESEKKQLPYDLVLMDWKMPVMDGVKTVQHLQEEHLNKLPAVIMVTAYGREEALGSAEQRGVQLKTVLSKPVNSSTLLEAIGEVLGRGIVIETRASEKAVDNAEVIAQLNGARLLVVEDNDMNQELAVELLNQVGIRVTIAGNGQESLDILAHDPAFDGVLMDCQMPVMDGYTATREIRKNPAFKALPIIAMTANAMAGDREKVIEAGMWDHIAKPLNVTEMYATIAKWVKPSAATGGATIEPTAKLPMAGGLPALPGIDLSAGLATTMNNQKLYTRMLVKFRDSQGRFAELFAAARQESDPKSAERAAHTLKGTAANIGARGVQAAASELEQACSLGKEVAEIDLLLVKVLAELEPVVAGLQQVDAGETADADRVPVIPEEELQTALDRLAALLEDNDSAAGDLLGELLDRIEGTPQARSLKPVADAINDYDFDAALEKLKTLKVEVNWS